MADCNNCPKAAANEPVPYISHKEDMALMARTNFRLLIVILVLVAALIGSNLAWWIYERSFETVEETTEEYEIDVVQDGEDGNNNFVGRDGTIINGETKD